MSRGPEFAVHCLNSEAGHSNSKVSLFSLNHLAIHSPRCIVIVIYENVSWTWPAEDQTPLFKTNSTIAHECSTLHQPSIVYSNHSPHPSPCRESDLPFVCVNTKGCQSDAPASAMCLHNELVQPLLDLKYTASSASRVVDAAQQSPRPIWTKFGHL